MDFHQWMGVLPSMMPSDEGGKNLPLPINAPPLKCPVPQTFFFTSTEWINCCSWI